MVEEGARPLDLHVIARTGTFDAVVAGPVAGDHRVDRPAERQRRAVYAAAGGCRIASTSMNSWMVSPITTPPPSIGMLVVMLKPFRSISPVAENPARVPP
jgi:hypothetical protein